MIMLGTSTNIRIMTGDRTYTSQDSRLLLQKGITNVAVGTTRCWPLAMACASEATSPRILRHNFPLDGQFQSELLALDKVADSKIPVEYLRVWPLYTATAAVITNCFLDLVRSGKHSLVAAPAVRPFR